MILQYEVPELKCIPGVNPNSFIHSYVHEYEVSVLQLISEIQRAF